MLLRLYVPLAALIFCCTVSCDNGGTVSSPATSINVQDSLQLFMNSIATDVSSKGPAAWLSVFENTPDFFMASDGRLAFKTYDSAKIFINNFLLKNITKIYLRWNDASFQMLNKALAQLSAGFHEEITDTKDSVSRYDGYFTALAHNTVKGWKLRNLHWSIIKN